ncbi:MAG: addiction module protein [Acidobacteria bacterium]|nr:addiction module protein [Acidobacteriota bacterium]
MLYGSEPEDETELESIPDWQRQILEERLADLERNPNDEQTWEEVKAELWPNR